MTVVTSNVSDCLGNIKSLAETSSTPFLDLVLRSLTECSTTEAFLRAGRSTELRGPPGEAPGGQHQQGRIECSPAGLSAARPPLRSRRPWGKARQQSSHPGRGGEGVRTTVTAKLLLSPVRPGKSWADWLLSSEKYRTLQRRSLSSFFSYWPVWKLLNNGKSRIIFQSFSLCRNVAK